jgi:hypothetical protein
VADAPFLAEPVLARLKDFQRRTVDYVFERLYAPDGSRRFLVADEVGLGKTLVARGVIARTLERLQSDVERVDVVYVCSNAAIAAQNVNRLNVFKATAFARATRLTYLPLQVHALKRNRVNFVSFTPGTTFDLKSRGGQVEERALLFEMLEGAAWASGDGLLNLLQGLVRTRKHWEWWTEKWRRSRSEPLDGDLAKAFREAVESDHALRERVSEACARFARYRQEVPHEDARYREETIGLLRNRLATTCLEALEPDLVILDEFQRFRDLLDGHDAAAELFRQLVDYHDPKTGLGVRTLLLSATPYKLLTLDGDEEDDHYPDFLRTLGFLFHAPDHVEAVKVGIQRYRRALLAFGTGTEAAIGEARDDLQDRLRRVMCRTERVGLTTHLDAMLSEPTVPANPRPEDLAHAALADAVARSVKARDLIEYWKSSPYLLNFLHSYELRRKVDKELARGNENLVSALHDARAVLLHRSLFQRYKEIRAANARMRALFDTTLDADLWRLLWLPASLPYVTPGGPYASVGSVTKSLVFSAWNAVPDAIAALCSYEAERRMVEGLPDLRHDQLYKDVKPLLRFTRSAERLNGMPVLAWLAPSGLLASQIDPLEISLRLGRGEPIPREDVLADAAATCKRLLADLPPGTEDGRPDERWYWAAVAMLEAKSHLAAWCLDRENGWLQFARSGDDASVPADDETAGDGTTDADRAASVFEAHAVRFVEAAKGALDPPLGQRPADLPLVLAELALAGPGVCGLRALRRLAPDLEADAPALMSGAAKIAFGFRTLFNLPETIGLLRGTADGESYWRLALQYGLDGNLQALLDEQVHVLVESLGLVDHPPAERVQGVAKDLAEALSLRTTTVTIDELRTRRGAIEHGSFRTRCRFALRFTDFKDSEQTIVRADTVRVAFNSPFRPFVLASTSIGQEGLDFHTWCHAVMHWNLPSNPVDLEQREGRVHRYKGHAVRKNVAERYGLRGLADWANEGDPWAHLFSRAVRDRKPGVADVVPFWVFEEGSARVERRVPLLPFSREIRRLARLKRGLALYRLVFGQPRQEDLMEYLDDRLASEEIEGFVRKWRICLEP